MLIDSNLSLTSSAYPGSLAISTDDRVTSGVGRVDEVRIREHAGGGGTECPSSVSYGGKTYPTILIGDQCWFRENLNIGSRINGNQEETNNSTIEKYCYNDNESNCSTYGGLYQWNEAMQYSSTEGAQGICPDGWHIPTKAEFEALKAEVNNSGNALKKIGQGTGNGAGTNTSGFSALLSGDRIYDGSFQNFGVYGDFWSSSYGIGGFYLGLDNTRDFIGIYTLGDLNGMSIRCIKD